MQILTDCDILSSRCLATGQSLIASFFQEEVYYSPPTWEGGFLLKGREERQQWEEFDTGTKRNASRPRVEGKVREWNGVDKNLHSDFHWSRGNPAKVVADGDEGDISWGRQGGRPGNNDEEVMVHIIL